MPEAPRARRGRTIVVIPVMMMMVVVFALGGCNRNNDDARHTKANAYVAERIVPMGKLVAAASDDGSIQTQSMPGDLLPEDAVTSLDDIRCQVAARDIPWGTVLRRSMFVVPAKLGLERGLTNDTSRPSGCD